jgi:hypothetical protein
MRASRLLTWATVLVATVVTAVTLAASAQDQPTLGTIRLPRAVVANGQALSAGSYTVRLTGDPVTPVVGQKDSERWVEFVQGGQVKGKELASVVAPADIRAVAEMTPPAAGSSKVQLLRGADYLRVWVNRGGTHYLVHLSLKN